MNLKRKGVPQAWCHDRKSHLYWPTTSVLQVGIQRAGLEIRILRVPWSQAGQGTKNNTFMFDGFIFQLFKVNPLEIISLKSRSISTVNKTILLRTILPQTHLQPPSPWPNIFSLCVCSSYTEKHHPHQPETVHGIGLTDSLLLPFPSGVEPTGYCRNRQNLHRLWNGHTQGWA